MVTNEVFFIVGKDVFSITHYVFSFFLRSRVVLSPVLAWPGLSYCCPGGRPGDCPSGIGAGVRSAQGVVTTVVCTLTCLFPSLVTPSGLGCGELSTGGLRVLVVEDRPAVLVPVPETSCLKFPGRPGGTLPAGTACRRR